MYARSTTFRDRPDAMEAGLAYVRDEVFPAVQQIEGCIGLSCLADRTSGRCVTTTAWASEEAMRASDALVAPLRERGAEIFAQRPEVQVWEVALMHRERPVTDGACARVTWTAGAPSSADSNVELFRDTVLPQAVQIPGFLSTSLLIDRQTGRGALATVWESREAMAASRETASRMRNEAVERMAEQVIEVAEFDVAVAHLRLPELV